MINQKKAVIMLKLNLLIGVIGYLTMGAFLYYEYYSYGVYTSALLAVWAVPMGIQLGKHISSK